MTERKILDLFAGAGGWDEGLRQLGFSAQGIETDELACATARAAGHDRIEADVAALDPADVATLWGLIASPPCQAYSVAGNRLGAKDKERVIACARELTDGRDTRSEHLAECEDERSLLTVEPLRLALALRPKWVALEQVPPVAQLWELFAELLGDHGYETAVGVLSAERYGVPQVRKRAFLIASLDGPVKLPEPSHQSFEPRRHKQPANELHLPRWVSMAEALGWGKEPAVLRSNHTNGGRNPGGSARSLDCPAFTLIGSSHNWKIEPGAGPRKSLRPTGADRRPSLPSDCQKHAERRSKANDDEPRRGVPPWTRSRPATTVVGEARIFGPGCWPRNGSPSHRVRRSTVRVTVEQAAILMGFRHHYPWLGSRSRRFTQIGNAVCPPVAKRVLGEAMGPSIEEPQ
jgi:DNA (cytosine-5)-methyltransferase 1